MNHPRGWKLFDDGTSAIDNKTPFRVSYFIHEEERFLYYSLKEEAFRFVQEHPEIEQPEIKDMNTCEVLYPKEL